MRKKFLLMMFALLGTVGAWAVQVTYYVTRADGAGTWFKADGSNPNSDDWFAVKFVSSDNVLTLISNHNGMNSNVVTDKGFRINHTARSGNPDIVSYTLSVPQGYTIVSYTFGAAPNGFNNNIIKISPNENMSGAVSVRKTPVEGVESQTSYTQQVNDAQESKFYLQQQPNEAIDVTLTVVVETTYEQSVRDYLTPDKIENVEHAGDYGYPKKTTKSYENILSLVEKLTQENAEWTEKDYENVKSYYEAYIAEEDIVIPETGKFYRIYASNSGKKFLLASGNKIIGRKTTEEALSNDASSIWYLGEDNKLTAFSSGYQYAGTANGFNVMGYEGGTKVDFIRCPSTFGKVSIRSNSSLWFIQASVANDTDLTTASDASMAGAQFYVGEVDALPIAISEAGLATFYSPVAVTVPDNVTAYTGKISADGAALNLTPVEGSTIPANTAVILEGKGEVSLPIAGDASVAETENEVFTGTISTIATPEGTDILTLQSRGDGKIGFYIYNGETLAGFKAYLTMPNDPAGVKGIDLNFGMTDAIREIVKDGQQAEAIYDLTGRRVEKAVKGIYIVNGKKTVIK